GLLPAAATGALAERGEWATKLRRALQPPVSHERAERDRSVGLDRVESRHAMQAHQVARHDLAAAHLDEEIGAAGQEAPVPAEARAELHRLTHGGWLVIVEAHGGIMLPAPRETGAA